MDLSFLMPMALVLSIISTGLFTTGLMTPYWFQGQRNEEGVTFHYGLFIICQQSDHCHSWTVQRQKLANYRGTRNGTPNPPGTGASEIFLCMNVIALLETDVILLWYTLRLPSQYWANSAWMCTLSGLMYGTVGTTDFIFVRKTIENHDISVTWGAILVFVAVACQALTALCIRVSQLGGRKLETEHTTISDSESTIPKSHPQPLTQWNKLLKTNKIRTLPNATSTPQTRPELLRLIQMQRMGNSRRHTLPEASARRYIVPFRASSDLPPESGSLLFHPSGLSLTQYPSSGSDKAHTPCTSPELHTLLCTAHEAHTLPSTSPEAHHPSTTSSDARILSSISPKAQTSSPLSVEAHTTPPTTGEAHRL